MEKAKTMTDKEKKELLVRAAEIRKDTMRAIASIGLGHVGGSLSVAELLAVLYFREMKVDPANPKMPDRDRLVMSKGHCGPALYSALAQRGFFDREILLTLNKPDTILPSHCDMNRTPGIDMTTGSLGQGISAAMGIAIANKLDKRKNTVYFVLGDGECQEGQVWEAAMLASHRKLDNVIGFLDYNGLQIDGTIDEICSLGDVAGRFTSFGWDCQTVDGHDPEAIADAIEKAKTVAGKPHMIVLKTVKGKGVSEFENKPSSHSATVSPEQLAKALSEMDEFISEVNGK